MLTQDLLNEIFTYDPETGKLERKVPTKFYGGRAAASSYPQVWINGRTHRVHRIVWLMVYGYIPKGMVIDHVNGNVLDNRLCNLRLATCAENLRNTKLADSTSGFKGVSPRRGKYRATIRVGGGQLYLGDFTSPTEAAMAYDKAAIEHFGEFARTNSMMGLLPNTSCNA